MSTDPAAPLLFFDSGIGGLSVLAETRRLLPDAPIIYACDPAGLPYGEKTEAEIGAPGQVLAPHRIRRQPLLQFGYIHFLHRYLPVNRHTGSHRSRLTQYHEYRFHTDGAISDMTRRKANGHQ